MLHHKAVLLLEPSFELVAHKEETEKAAAEEQRSALPQQRDSVHRVEDVGGAMAAEACAVAIAEISERIVVVIIHSGSHTQLIHN